MYVGPLEETRRIFAFTSTAPYIMHAFTGTGWNGVPVRRNCTRVSALRIRLFPAKRLLVLSVHNCSRTRVHQRPYVCTQRAWRPTLLVINVIRGITSRDVGRLCRRQLLGSNVAAPRISGASLVNVIRTPPTGKMGNTTRVSSVPSRFNGYTVVCWFNWPFARAV